MKKLIVLLLIGAIMFTFNIPGVNIASDVDPPNVIKPIIQTASDVDPPNIIKPIITIASDVDPPNVIILPKV